MSKDATGARESMAPGILEARKLTRLGTWEIIKRADQSKMKKIDYVLVCGDAVSLRVVGVEMMLCPSYHLRLQPA